MNTRAAPPEPGSRPIRGSFIQTDRAAHELWAQFSIKHPMATGVLHLLSARVSHYDNAVVMPQKTMAKILRISDRSVRKAVAQLEAANWIQVVRLGAGRECAYVLNDKVAWADSRENLRLSSFSATIIADSVDQSEKTLMDKSNLHRLPSMFGDEVQLPSGEGLPPVSQPFLGGMEPDLPSRYREEEKEG